MVIFVLNISHILEEFFCLDNKLFVMNTIVVLTFIYIGLGSNLHCLFLDFFASCYVCEAFKFNCLKFTFVILCIYTSWYWAFSVSFLASSIAVSQVNFNFKLLCFIH